MELVNSQAIANLVKQEVKIQFQELMKKESVEPRTIGMKEFCHDFCHGKGEEWVRLFIFDEFPEPDIKNGGWVLNPRRIPGPGKQKTSILVEPARKWLDEHEREIDWNEPIPK